MVATVFVGKRPPTSAAAPRAHLSRRCPCVGRCTFGNGSRTRRGCKARNHPWAWEGAGPPRPWLTLFLPERVDHLVTPERVGHECRHPDVVVCHESQHADCP